MGTPLTLPWESKSASSGVSRLILRCKALKVNSRVGAMADWGARQLLSRVSAASRIGVIERRVGFAANSDFSLFRSSYLSVCTIQLPLHPGRRSLRMVFLAGLRTQVAQRPSFRPGQLQSLCSVDATHPRRALRLPSCRHPHSIQRPLPLALRLVVVQPDSRRFALHRRKCQRQQELCRHRGR
jgi:hypothetical protein